MTINTTLQFFKIYKKFSIKTTLTDELKIFDQAQYILDREAATISAISSKELDKFQYLTGEDLGCKPGVVERAHIEYSPLGEAFNKVF